MMPFAMLLLIWQAVMQAASAQTCTTTTGPGFPLPVGGNPYVHIMTDANSGTCALFKGEVTVSIARYRRWHVPQH